MITDDWLDLPDLLDNVQDFLDLGFFEEAEALLDKYETIFQSDWEYHFLRSRIFTDQNRPREAIPHLLKGLRIERDNADCMLGIFYAYAMMGQVKRGGRFLLKAEELHPENELILSALIWYHTEANAPEKAIACFERAQAINSNNPDTYRNAGIAFDRLGRFEEAEACYKAALMLSPTFEEARDLYADHLIFTGKPEEAARLYEEALGESPKNIRHISKLIYCLSQMGQFDKAEALAKHSVSLYPNSPLGYIDLAYVNLNTDNLSEAADNAGKAMAIAPLDAECYRVAAIAVSESGNFEDAEALFEQAISLDPENAGILRDHYRHLRAALQYERMIEIINKVIEIEYPYCTEDYWFMADYYREKKQNLQAFRYLRLAHKSMPSEKELLPPMIEILLEQGRTKYSLPLFADYVQRSGWTDVMSNFMMNKQFKNRTMREGMRFLRFIGERPTKFRKFVFDYYLYRFGFMYYTLIAITLMFPAGVLFGWIGAGGVGAAYGLSLGALKIFKNIKFKRSVIRANQAGGVGWMLAIILRII
ncbi:MAG: tetratricopeptide repeat protein [Chitinispirillales bacterium]|jgi:tetratricopeptide (TPR) repeat protein|nr:tetratricopeptide repeat protein [Chitinispirillales bacterium]